VTKISEVKNSFLLIISDVLVHGCLTLLLWSWGEAEYHDRECAMVEAAHGGWRIKEQKKWLEFKYVLQGHIPT
jgi:hypothetical protein